jgi:protein-tyrosine-phosphatase
MKILITGDSFATDWTKKYDGIGWVNMLCNDFEITNIAEAGVSEYKIYKQLESVDINEFDRIIVSHTSPYRIPIKQHPIHSNDMLHKNCDLIYGDIKEHIENPIAKMAADFYENLYDIDYACFIHNLIIKEINLKHKNLINITFFKSNKNMYNFEDIFLKNKGLMNHMNKTGNEIIYNKIKDLLIK